MMSAQRLFVEALLSHCSLLFSAKSPLLLAFFLGGLTGGFTHCLTMCGPFVACRNMCASGGCSSKTQAAQLPYHLGRFTTYGLLGFFVAFLSRQITYLSYWPMISAGMLAIAGLMFLLSSLPKCNHLFKSSGKLTYVSGLLLGFMPCGLLYAALMMAATTANPLMGMVGMWMFVLGTMPALLVASLGAEIITRKWQGIMQKAGRAMMAFNGIILLVMAEKLVR